jgi:hypothetical protein
LKYTDVSEVRTASIIRAINPLINALIPEAVRTSETSVYFNETTRAMSQKAVIFIHADVIT